ncbi:hypothetical protein LC609_32270 [Nostoc sp. XA013]|nr:hypothetical protein [Nostoc sp. XA013]
MVVKIWLNINTPLPQGEQSSAVESGCYLGRDEGGGRREALLKLLAIASGGRLRHRNHSNCHSSTNLQSRLPLVVCQVNNAWWLAEGQRSRAPLPTSTSTILGKANY